MLKFLENNNLKFKKIADDFQLILNDAADLQSVIKIDPTLWAVNSLPINNVVFNYEFLKYIDTDNNNKIHPIQFIDSLKWLFSILIKYDGITTQSQILSLTNLNKENYQSKLIAYATRFINKQIKAKPKNIISLQTVLNFKIDNIDDESFLNGYNLLKKLLLFQRYMIQFANNYVTLDSLYNPHTLSIMQPGYLIMNGTYYTLAAKVENILQHKAIIKRSNICVIYVDLTSKNQNMCLCFAITSGLKKNLYIGKTGIFIDRRDCSQWDAKIIDIVDQPISFLQAFISPFVIIHNFIMNNIQRKVSYQQNNIQYQNQTFKEIIQYQKNQPPEKPNFKNTALNSIGIAALGSAGAFILSSLKSISLISALYFFITLILIIGIPIIIFTMYKLYNRSITEFYTASGWSINPKIRLKRKMCIIFTYSLKNAITMQIIKDDLIKKFINQFQRKINYKKIIFINSFIVIILIIIAILLKIYFF